MSKCKWIKKDLSAFLDGELKSTRESQVLQHLNRCEECRLWVDEQRAVTNSILNMVENSTAEIDVQAATNKIMRQIAQSEQQLGFKEKFDLWMDGLFIDRRRMVTGALIALAIGALVAPLIMWWMGTSIETMEIHDPTGKPQTAISK